MEGIANEVDLQHGFTLCKLNAGLENIFLFQAAKSKIKIPVYMSNIKLPAYVDFGKHMVPYIVIYNTPISTFFSC